MGGNSFGKAFVITTFGESHGPGIGVVVDGCPAGIQISAQEIQADLDRRRPGQSDITSPRQEADQVQILSGIFEQNSTGAPIALWIANTNHKPADYQHLQSAYRPSHADYTYEQKYGIRDYRGGGRSSARETAARVAAGAIAKKLLSGLGIEILAYVSQVGDIRWLPEETDINREKIEASPIRCPEPGTAAMMLQKIEAVKMLGDTIGGRVSCLVRGVPVGWGEPVFDKLHAELGKAMLSINAVKGFQIGSGFDGLDMTGSEQNDVFEMREGTIRTRTNHSGGIQGGISNGENIWFDVAFKPVATLMQDQDTVNAAGETITIEGKGRHDPCVLPRAVPIVEAMAALVLADAFLRARLTRV